MRTIIALIAVALAFPAAAQSRHPTSNTSISQSAAYSQSSVKQTQKLQAPGIAAGGGDCTSYFGITAPGAGIVAGGMGKPCRDQIEASVAREHLGARAARGLLCNRTPYKNLRECGGRW